VVLLLIVDFSLNLNRLDSEVQLWNDGGLWLGQGVDLDFFSKDLLIDLFLDMDDLFDNRLNGFDLFNDRRLLDGLDDLNDRLDGLSFNDRDRRSLIGFVELDQEFDSPVVRGKRESARIGHLEV
jgi:hypothetical protein